MGTQQPTAPPRTDPLDTLERKLCLVRDRVGAVVRGLETGFYLFGPGGIGKSYRVLGHLASLEAAGRTRPARCRGSSAAGRTRPAIRPETKGE